MSLSKLQNLFRLKRKNFQNYTLVKVKIVGIVKKIKAHYDFEFRNKQLREDIFYEVQTKLDHILEDYKEILSFYDMGFINYRRKFARYKENMQKIRELIRIYGCDFETIFLIENITFAPNMDCEVIEMLKSSFYSTSYKIMDTNESQPESETTIMENLNILPFYFSRINSTSDELINQCFAARAYFKLVDNKVLCVDGVFLNWANHLSTNLSKHFMHKYAKIKEKVGLILTVKNQYKNNWLQQLNLREICAVPIDDIDKELLELTKLHREYKNKKTNLLVNSFVAAEKIDKRKIILSLLLSPKDSEIFYLGRLFLHFLPNRLVKEIQTSLHPSIQSLIYQSSITLFENINPVAVIAGETEDDYEKRILMMKTSEKVKRIALLKLKEVNMKSTEGSSKAQQFLDGLLKIPFGIERTEEVFGLIEIFSDNFPYIDPKARCSHFNDYFSNGFNETVAIENNIRNMMPAQYKEFLKNMKAILNTKRLMFREGDKSKYVTEKNPESMIMYMKLNINNPRIRSMFLKIIEKAMESYNTHMLEWNKILVARQNYITKAKEHLDKSIYGQKEAKLAICQIIGQWLNGTNNKGYCFGFEGPPGTGKTSLAKNGIAKCLVDKDGSSRPIGFIAIGGSTNGSYLEGHSYTYVGSSWGKIVDILMNSQCMNPIIYIDELDKISQTEQGKELVGILTHITDLSQNMEFMDKYFSGITIDLSKVLFIFSYNDPGLIDPILRDRIQVIPFDSLSKKEKKTIYHDYIHKEICQTIGISLESIDINDDIIDFIIDEYTCEAGVRKFREKLFEIFREVNVRNIMDPDKWAFPVAVTKTLIEEDLFATKPKTYTTEMAKKPTIGVSTGMYASSYGVGGITLIQAYLIPSTSPLSLELTGHQGNIMKESMSVSKTIAWSLISKDEKEEIQDEWKKHGFSGLHVHCPDGGTPKDGPSAGIAITVAMLSVLLKKPVENTVAMTGEIDLHGAVHKIGGLNAKLVGAKQAHINTVLVPKENTHDIELILNKDPDLFDENFRYIFIESIYDAMPYVFQLHT